MKKSHIVKKYQYDFLKLTLSKDYKNTNGAFFMSLIVLPDSCGLLLLKTHCLGWNNEFLEGQFLDTSSLLVNILKIFQSRFKIIIWRIPLKISFVSLDRCLLSDDLWTIRVEFAKKPNLEASADGEFLAIRRCLMRW